MKSNQHIDTGTLIRLADSEGAGCDLPEVLSHLESCGRCRSRLERLPGAARRFFFERMEMEEVGLSDRRGAGMPYGPENYDRALDSVFESLVQESSRLDRERLAAPALLAELAGLPPNQQALRIRNTPRFHTWGLAEYLLEQSRAGCTADPIRAERWAELALLVAGQLETSGFKEKVRRDLLAETWGCIANSRRIRTDFRGSGEAFRRAEELLALGTGDPIERTRLLDLKSSYLLDKQDFREAEQLLGEVIRTYRVAGERHLEGRALLKLAKVHGDSRRPEEALAGLEAARKLVCTEEEPRLALVVHTNIVLNLTELGRFEQAHERLPQVRTLVREHGDRLDRLRILWIEGLICQGLGRPELAEEALKQTRAGFIDAEIGYDVALVSLDLAALYLESGRTGEVKRLASEMLPQFAARQIHREGLLALSLFEHAARKEQATLGLVERVASRVERFRNGKTALDA